MSRLRYLALLCALAVPAACGGSSTKTVTVSPSGPTSSAPLNSSNCPPSPSQGAPPTLTLPFKPGTKFRVTEGWCYSTGPTGEQRIHGLKIHAAIDFGAPEGTPVVASTDGYAVASYELGTSGTYRGKTVDFGYGHVVQIWDPKDHFLTLYGHLSRVTPGIYYDKPKQIGSIWRSSALSYTTFPPDKFVALGTPVKRGQVIGYVGDSGLGLGVPESPSQLPSRSWDEMHLHFEVYVHGVAQDPFDLYNYFQSYQSLQQGPNGLWLTDSAGKPKFP